MTAERLLKVENGKRHCWIRLGDLPQDSAAFKHLVEIARDDVGDPNAPYRVEEVSLAQ